LTFIGATFRLFCMTNDNVDLDTPIAYRQVSDLERAYVDLGRAMDAHGRVTCLGVDRDAIAATRREMDRCYGRLAVFVAAAARGVSSSRLLDLVSL
jgi:hypothetical protein